MLALFSAFALAPVSSQAAEKQKAAIFDFELIDSSLQGEMEGENPDEQRRLQLISGELRERLAASDHYEVVDLTPAKADIEAAGLIRGCNGCDAKIAEQLGADVSISGTVQKVSNLILNINLYVRDAETRKKLQVMSVDIRGNTDKSWSRGVSYLVRNRLLRDK